MAGGFINATSIPASEPHTVLHSQPRRSYAVFGKILLRIVVTAGVLAFIFWKVQWTAVWSAVAAIPGFSLISVLVLCVPVHVLQFARWSMLAYSMETPVRRADVHRGYWVGYTLGIVTPGRVGQYGRALALRNCSLAEAFGVSFLERAYAGFVINGLGLLALGVLPFIGWRQLDLLAPSISMVAVLVGLCVFSISLYPRVLHHSLTWLAKRLPWREKLMRALSVLDRLSFGRAVGLTFVTVLGLAAALAQFVILLRGMGSAVPWMGGMLAVLLTFFLKGLLPITVGSLGIAEWSAMVVLNGYGVVASTAVAASLLVFTLNVLIPAIIGTPFLQSLRGIDLRTRTGT